MSDIATTREILEKLLKTDADLDSFCIDNFPDVQRRFSAGMDRVQKLNLLLQLEQSEDIRRRLHLRKPQEMEKILRDLGLSPLGETKSPGGSGAGSSGPPGRPPGDGRPPQPRKDHGLLLSLGLGALLIVLMAGGVGAGRQLSRTSSTAWWLISTATFSLLATAVSAAIGGAVGVWQSRKARLMGPPAIFVVILTVMTAASRVMNSLPGEEWLARGEIQNLPPERTTEVRISGCPPVQVSSVTGHVTFPVTPACDRDQMNLTIAVSGFAPQHVQISREQAKAGFQVEWKAQASVSRIDGIVRLLVGDKRIPLSGVQVSLAGCPDSIDVRPSITDNNGRFMIQPVPTSCRNPPFQLKYLYDGRLGEATADRHYDISIDIKSPEKSTSAQNKKPGQK